MQPLVSIITVNYNQPQLTAELLRSIKQLNYPNLEVIVVDNGSTANAVPYLQGLFPNVTYLRSEENLGFAGGNNIGIKQAKGDFLFLVNNDTELPANVLTLLLPVFDCYPNAGVVCPMILFYPAKPENKALIQFAGYTPINPFTARNRTIGEFEPNEGQYTQPAYTPYAHGAAMLIKKEVIQKAGLLPEMYFLYYEELDWSEQIKNAGFTILVEPRATVYHKESMSVGKQSPLKIHYITRNRILFMRRHASVFHFWIFLAFFALFTLPKNMLLFMVRQQWAHLSAFWQAVCWHLQHNTGKSTPYNPLTLKQPAI